MAKIKKYKIILLVCLVFTGFFIFSNQAKAIIGTGIFDYVDTVLNALDFIDQQILGLLVKLILLAFASSGFVVLSAHLFQWAISIPVNISNPTVWAGWTFVSGLVNIFFVLSIIFIALGYILKIESLQSKKSFVRLVIVILLVNFSLLIVGIFTDIAQFFMNTFIQAFGTDFVSAALRPLQSSFSAIINVMLVTVTAYVASAFTAFGSIFSLAILLTQTFMGSLLGDIFSMVVLIAMNLVLGAIYFIYFILFLIRIAALWLLSIFAPLAFFCLIFPQTEKYFKKWLTFVVQWAFLGVVALFLTGLITTLYTQSFVVRPGNIDLSAASGLPSFRLPDSTFDYLFLLCFLAVAFHITKKYVPAGADVAISKLEGAYKGMGGFAGIMKKAKKAGGKVTRAAGHTKTGEKMQSRMQQWSTQKGGAKSGGLVNKSWKSKMGRAYLNSTKEMDKGAYNEAYQQASKEQDSDKNVEAYLKTNPVDAAKRSAILQSMMEQKQTGGIDKLVKDKDGNVTAQGKLELTKAYDQLGLMGKKEEQKNMERAFTKDMPEEFGVIQGRRGTYTKEQMEKDGFKSYGEKIIKEAKDDNEIKSLQKGWHSDKDLMEAAHKFWAGPQISEAAKKFGQGFVSDFEAGKHDAVHNGNSDWYYEIDEKTGQPRNSRLPGYLASNTAQEAGFTPIEGLNIKDKIKKRNDKMRKDQEKWKNSKSTPQNMSGATKSSPEATETEPRSIRQVLRERQTPPPVPPIAGMQHEEDVGWTTGKPESIREHQKRMREEEEIIRKKRREEENMVIKKRREEEAAARKKRKEDENWIKKQGRK
ncbi:MAG: type IV secretion system protein [Candidatus Nealsonbacteria bacterium]|nr:type IV secretion system protein [Candidatus Nealsonbacteria bacterium]